MKKFLLINFFLMQSLLVSSQVTITLDDLPSAGKGYLLGGTTNGLESISIGSSGSTSWDFSGIVKSEQDTGGTLLPSQTAYPDAFPSATHATYNADADGKTYTYYTLDAEKAEVTGIVFISSQLSNLSVKLLTVKVLDYYTLPITMGHKSQSTGTYKGKGPYVYQSLPLINVDSIEVTLDLEKNDTVEAFGSIKTPTGTYDAILLKTVAKRTISFKGKNYGVWTDGSAVSPPKTAIETSYNWWANGQGNEVFKIVYEDTASIPSKITWLESAILPTGVEDESFSAEKATLTPNPTSNVLNISPAISLIYDLRIDNMQGEQVLAKQNMIGSQSIHVEALLPGVYVASLSYINGKNYKTKFIVQR